MTSERTRQQSRPGRWIGAVLLAATTILVPAITAGAAAANEPSASGESVYIGSKVGYGGTGVFPIWSAVPATGDPDLWAYCVEHDVDARTRLEGVKGNLDSFLGENYFTDPIIQGKVLWVLSHSYPALSLADFGLAVGAPEISLNDALEATQYAIWRYTDLNYDAAWSFETPDSATAYWSLVNGANASSGLTPADLEVTASVTAPTAQQVAKSLVGPFTVTTNRPTVSVSVDQAVPLVNQSGEAIDSTAVVNGQQLFLDLRDSAAAGSATVTVTAAGSSSTGQIVSVPNSVGSAPTAADHAQTIILVAPSATTTAATASVQWAKAVSGAPTQPVTSTQPATSTQAATTAGPAQLANTGFEAIPGLLAVAFIAIVAGVVPQLVRRRAQ